MLETILASIKSLELRVVALEGMAPKVVETLVAVPVKKTSIKEFLIEKKPKDGVQTTLAIAYYLEIKEGISPLNKADLEKGFRAAKETVPGNINDKVNMSVKNGHMMESGSKKDSMKTWVLTSTGEQYVEQGFSSNGK